MRSRALVGLVLAVVAALVAAGCYHGRYHSYEPYPVHVHFDGCGHYYWHDTWFDGPHPHDCYCGGAFVAVHVHGSYCGHYHWHGGWWDYAHPYDCHLCAPSVVTILAH